MAGVSLLGGVLGTREGSWSGGGGMIRGSGGGDVAREFLGGGMGRGAMVTVGRGGEVVKQVGLDTRADYGV